MSAYTDLLRHPKWQQRRLKIMERDGFRCSKCSADEKMLHVHHTLYRKGAKPWEYEDHELVTLCDDCHKAVHDGDGIVVVTRLEWDTLMDGIRYLTERSAELEDLQYLLARERDLAWRAEHPDEAAALDAQKARMLVGLRAVR